MEILLLTSDHCSFLYVPFLIDNPWKQEINGLTISIYIFYYDVVRHKTYSQPVLQINQKWDLFSIDLPEVSVDQILEETTLIGMSSSSLQTPCTTILDILQLS